MNKTMLSVLLLSSSGFYTSQTVWAGGEYIANLPTITMQASGDNIDPLNGAFTASQGTITQEQIETRPLSRPAEVLETIPGVIVTQHSGSGKANQYFLRGFNLDHGTDFATSLDGQPLNMVTHAHGQGYTDLNFLIPELIHNIDYHKGATSVDDGDFASAGTAKIYTLHTLERPFAQVTLGNHDLLRFLGVGHVKINDGELIGAFENQSSDGPWTNPENLSKQNLFLKYFKGDEDQNTSFGLQHYQAKWDATDQIPEHLVQNGQLDRFDSLDPSDGGKSKRTALWFNRNQRTDREFSQFSAYAVRSELNLFSNFTYFLDDPLRGDQFEQAEKRTLLGLKFQKGWSDRWYDKEMLNIVGSSLRYDDIDGLGLHQTQNRQRFNTIREDDVKQTTLGVWGQNQIAWQPWLRSIIGLRGDLYHFNVNSDRNENSGRKTDHILSPKFSLILGPW
ncbi:TonB-dependent receptor, partial [uncultured Acinetobacter sp.]|uniref:TonB-dependent receptor n=1 Tax=uncultured Acinetobacter sp. TaxID=165433 RepID=UPI00374A1375